MSKFQFKKNIDLGNLEAENDKLLIEAFVQKDDIISLRDINSDKCILLGRTGSGKSALIKFLEHEEENIKRIEPETLSLKHLSNSTIISYFKKLDVKLDFFYITLWKHILVVELIKLRYNDEVDKSIPVFEWLKNKIKKDKRRVRAIAYLEKWGGTFWEETEHRVREIEQNLEGNFRNEFTGGINLKKIMSFSAKSTQEKKEHTKIISEYKSKAQKVVNELQIADLTEIHKILIDIFSKSKKKYFIVIDDLDKDWVDEGIVYGLIKSLIGVIKDFRQIPNVKIIVALRTNIHYKIFKKNSSRGVQREKYQHLNLKIEWEKEDLKKIINKRLEVFMKGIYTNASPTIDEILPEIVENTTTGFEYILERTLFRPRDVIAFFNLLITKSNGKTNIEKDTIKNSEMEYSNGRLDALNDEWLDNFGNIKVLYSFLKKQPSSFTYQEIEDVVEKYFYEQISSDKIDELSQDISHYFKTYREKMKEIPLKEILVILYEIGFIGIRISPESKINYMVNSTDFIEEDDLEPASKFYVHKMLRKALRIKDIK